MFTIFNQQFLQKVKFNNLSFYPLTLLIVIVVFLYKNLYANNNKGKKRPPSPPKLPFIGNLHQVGNLPHQSFAALSKQYGKTMLLHFGRKPILVLSSPEGAREVLKTQDLVFCNRPKTSATDKFFYGCKDVGFSPYSEHWRMMKSICIMQLLCNKRVQSIRNIRLDEVALALKKVSQYATSSLVMNLSEIIKTQTYDVICRSTFGRKYGKNDEGGYKFLELLDETMELLGVFCVGDFIPWLSVMDRLSGLDARLKKIAKELDELLDKVIQEHQYRLKTKKIMNEERNFVENLLDHQLDNKESIPMNDIKAVILDVFAAGFDTTYTLLEWAMTELIRHPRVMKELQDEVRKTVEANGDSMVKVGEEELEKLTYLKAVLKEALRLHPPAPMLVFREPLQDAKINGFDIDARTHLFINAWAIHRDPAYWDEPMEFRPERFLGDNASFNFKGQDHFHYTPFGGGRRLCPGTAFAMVNAELMLANLIYEFDWKWTEECGKLDMTENMGITVHKRLPLKLVATPAK